MNTRQHTTPRNGEDCRRLVPHTTAGSGHCDSTANRLLASDLKVVSDSAGSVKLLVCRTYA
jgi:hypothetical protein